MSVRSRSVWNCMHVHETNFVLWYSTVMLRVHCSQHGQHRGSGSSFLGFLAYLMLLCVPSSCWALWPPTPRRWWWRKRWGKGPCKNYEAVELQGQISAARSTKPKEDQEMEFDQKPRMHIHQHAQHCMTAFPGVLSGLDEMRNFWNIGDWFLKMFRMF